MKGSTNIIKKELMRVFSDRKLCFSLFLLPAILVIAIYALIGQVVSGMNNDIVEHTSIVSFVNAPADFLDFCKQSGYTGSISASYLSESDYISDRDTLEQQILDGSADMIVYFETGFADTIKAYKQPGDRIPEVKVFYNSTENYSSRAASVFSEMVITPYKNALLAERLGSLEILNVFTVSSQLIVNEKKANAEFISMMLPYLVVILLFSGAMSVTVDAFAGEKERGTMSSMLLSPISRSEIAFGKIVALGILTSISSIFYAIGMVIAVPLLDDSMSSTGISGFGGLSLGITEILQLFVIFVTLVYLFVSIIALLSTFAKDTKTASTLVSPCYIVVMMLGMITMFAGTGEIEASKYLIPVYGACISIRDICSGSLTGLNLLSSLAASIVPSVVITYMLTRAFNSEKIMFNA